MAYESTGAPAPNKPRRFAPVPVETTTRSSRKGQGNASESQEPNNNTSPSEVKPAEDCVADKKEKAPTTRRFAPQPVETTSRSSRRKLPEPVETKTTLSRGGAASKEEPSGEKPRRKFVPEPVETTTRRRGGRRSRNFDDEDEDMPDLPSRQSSTGSTSSGVRKFSPELVETVRGSYRQRTPYGGSPETPASPLNGEFHYNVRPRSPKTARATSPRLEDSRFSAASLARRLEKRHSFIVPDLPSIPSDSSEGSAEETSGATSPSTISAGAVNQAKTVKAKSSGEQLSLHLLDLAAKVAERQLREQALAAFPNEHFHQPVDHYALEDDEDETDKPGTLTAHGGVCVSRFRRDSAADLDLELSRMRNHHIELERIEEEVKNRAKATGDSPFSAAALAAKKGIDLKKDEDPAKVVGRWQKDVGLAQMRHAASPPMLGGDIKFPMSLSPKHTRCDPDQVPVPRRQDSDGDVEMDNQHLWSPKVSVQNSKDAGLWMGSCARVSRPPTPGHDYRRSGLMTPAVEMGDPFNPSNHASPKEPPLHQSLFMRELPLTPATSRTNPSMDNMERMLEVEKAVDEEFNDAFVTQIYNYLSLGYPSLAHPFDHELSKISRIDVEDLRKDDKRTNAKGYVGAPEGEGLEEQEVLEGKCARWTALRLYIKEWARQQPNMAERMPEDWGARARRGSWAI